MNFSRQALLGIGMIIGGSVMLYAMVQQIGASDRLESTPALIAQPPAQQAEAQPLTIDIETEKRILAQKQKERTARVAEQEKRATLFLAEQEAAEAEALAKSRAENQQYIENNTPIGGDKDSPEAAQNTVATPKLQPRIDNKDERITASNTLKTDAQQIAQAQQQALLRQAKIKEQAEKQDAAQKLADSKEQLAAQKRAQAKTEEAAKKRAEEQAAAEQKKQAEKQAAIEAAKNEPPKVPTDYAVKSGDGLLRLARQYNMPVEALAQANNMSPSASLQLGQTLTIPSRKQIDRLEREAANAQQARENKRQKEEAAAKKSSEAQQKLREARKEVRATDAKGSFGVQVTLATNQAAADNVAKRFRAAGYQVKTSPTSRGVRVVIGPERGKVAALALKDKINSDPDVNTSGAWVLYWP